jgi:prevent-host-death family protein
MKESIIGASEFKAKCLSLIDRVATNGDNVVITKRGRPVARLVPALLPKRILGGSWEGIVEIKGDLVNFHDDWGPDQ